jgi:hypothetical protein
MSANAVYDNSMTSIGAPSDGRSLTAWATSYEIKMRKRARKRRRAERWHRWLGRSSP